MLFRLLLFSGMILIAGVGALSVPGSNTGDAAGSSGASGASGGTSTAGGTSGNAGSAASGATSGASSGAKKLASNPSAATSGSAMQCCNTLARPDNLNQCRSKIGRSTICAKLQSKVCIVEYLEDFAKPDCGRFDEGDYETWQNFQPYDGTYKTFPLWPYRYDDVHKQCAYRKCAAQCPDGNTNPGSQRTGRNAFEYNGQIRYRQWYCCNDNPLCNGASGSFGYSRMGFLVVLFMVLFMSAFF